MRVLVTGGAGFIGSHLTDELMARGDEVAVVDDLSSGRLARLDPQATVHKLSITDAAALTEVTGSFRPDLICHLAAQIDVVASVAAPAQDEQVNVLGTVNVLEAARRAGARVVFASSGGALYGRDAPIPSREDELPLPESPYGIAKYCAEQYIGLYNRLHGTRHSVLRFANVYGPRQDPAGEAGVITIFCASALAGQDPTIYGDGTQTRDYVYVGDTVRAFLAAADSHRPGTWNIGAGAEVTVLSLVDVIAGIAGHPLTPRFTAARPGELLRSAVAVDRAAAELGWRPTMPLTDGIARVYRWIEAGAPDRAAF
jgi:UDP-glucose 4-epimerase